MKHLFRFLGERSGVNSWTLPADEWHHIIKVLRLTVGEGIELADGLGWVASARLSEVHKHNGEFVIESEIYSEKPGGGDEFTLGLGVLKPQGIDEILPGLVELGVSHLVLIPFSGMDKSRLSERLLDRWQRQIVSASKQAKAPWFPRLSVAKGFESFIEEASTFPSRFLLDPAGEIISLPVGSLRGPLLAVVGSEGGWSEGELEKFKAAGFRLLRIRSHILRATTAAIATAALFRQAICSE